MALCFVALAENVRAAAPPNIVFLLTDDQRYDTLGATGNQIIQTPHIDRLAAEGVSFDRAFVTTSICAINRACIFTGQYARRHGIENFGTSFTPQQLAETYPAQLKKAGYRIAFIGKFGVGKKPEGFFDYDRGFNGQNKYFHQINGRTRHLTSVIGDQAIEFLDGQTSDQPFCLSISFKAPHVQDNDPRQFLYDPRLEHLYEDVVIPPAPLSDPAFFNALPEFLRKTENRARWKKRFATPEMYQRSVKGYYRLISGVDDVVGRIVDKLHEKNLRGNTVIIYSSDHGFYLGERGFAGKWFAHDVSIHIPLIVDDPRAASARRGVVNHEMVLSIDLAPTMLDLAGVTPPAGMQGRSLLPLVRGQHPEWRDEFFYEHLFRHRRIPRSEGVRTEQYKYIRYIDSDPLYEELYDLEIDPDEANNLATSPEHRQLLETMRKKWEMWRERAK